MQVNSFEEMLQAICISLQTIGAQDYDECSAESTTGVLPTDIDSDVDRLANCKFASHTRGENQLSHRNCTYSILPDIPIRPAQVSIQAPKLHKIGGISAKIRLLDSKC